MVGDAEPDQPAPEGQTGTAEQGTAEQGTAEAGTAEGGTAEEEGTGEAGAIPALLVIAPDLAEEQSTPVYDGVVVGRECAGVDERHRLLIEDPAISRMHLEARLDLAGDQAWLTDHSTNGTRLNGKRIERSIPVRIKPGDRVRLGEAELQFRSRRFSAMSAAGAMATLRQINVTEMVLVVGDILSFSTIAESADDRLLLENIDRLYAELRQILARHHGTLSNYVCDAFFATWEIDAVPDAAREAVTFAIESAESLPRIAAGLGVRDPDGGPLRMGWGVASGPAAVSQLTGMLVTVLGDATNVAFRLSGLAGRDGRPDVLVTDAVHRVTSMGFAFTPASAIQVKGRTQSVETLGARRL
jgi:adenylate cyclase